MFSWLAQEIVNIVQCTQINHPYLNPLSQSKGVKLILGVIPLLYSVDFSYEAVPTSIDLCNNETEFKLYICYELHGSLVMFNLFSNEIRSASQI